MMKTMTEIMITATCIYDNHPEYDDTPFLYEDTPQERKDINKDVSHKPSSVFGIKQY